MTDKTPPEALSAPRDAVQATDGPAEPRDGHGGSETDSGSPLREQIAAAIEDEVYEYRERTMFWEETGGVTQEIAKLATRGAMTVRDREMERLRAKVAEIDHIINWHTTCASCARILDSSYAETMRREQAEAALTRVAHVADLIEAGAPWTANQANTARRIRDAANTSRHDAGPSVKECAEADARWWNSEKAGE